MLLRLSLILILATTQAFAQRGGGGRGGGDMASMSSTSVSRLDTISRILQLSKEQTKYVKTTLDDAQKEAAPVRMQLVKRHEAIGDAVQAGKSPEEIKGLISNHTALESQMAQIELKAFAKIYMRLDKAQQDKSRPLSQMMKGIFNEKNWNEAQ